MTCGESTDQPEKLLSLIVRIIKIVVEVGALQILIRGIELRLDRSHDLLGNIVLDSEGVRKLAIITFSADMMPSRRIQQMRRDTSPGCQRN